MMLHYILKDAIDQEFTEVMVKPTELSRDALLVSLRNGTTIELRIATPTEYSIGWRWGDAEFRIDTAPLHQQLATFPNHLHDGDRGVLPDPLTHPGDDPWDNVRRVISAVSEDPRLQTHGGEG